MEEILASIRQILTEEESDRATADSRRRTSPMTIYLVLDSTAMVPAAPAEQTGGSFSSESTLDSQSCGRANCRKTGRNSSPHP